MLLTNHTITKLGYSNQDLLFYRGDSWLTNNDISSQSQKILNEINPEAVLFAEGNPFIVFLENCDHSISLNLMHKIWNTQIPITIVSFPDCVKVYNSSSLGDGDLLVLLDELSSNSLNEQSAFSLNSISNVHFWEKYAKQLEKPKLSSVLLSNIQAATTSLKETQCKSFAVKILLRLIFIRYMIDRGVDLNFPGLSSITESSQSNFLEILQNKHQLYSLFAHLKNKFNGNLFDLYVENGKSELEIIDTKALGILSDLMSGAIDLRTTQRSLFPLYNFAIIPVELISSIYEKVLNDKQQDADKAFYTPLYLASYLVEQTITPFLAQKENCKILDPACGSGIFLAEIARKILEKAIRKEATASISEEQLKELIVDNIWGIDKNEEAIDVAIFSLYLTILDYKDPKTIRNFSLPLLKNKNLLVSDFFDHHLDETLQGQRFDFIIGNPPWGEVKGLHINYCKKNRLPLHRDQIARSFLFRTKDFSHAATCCCLIVTSKLFYNTSKAAVSSRAWLLKNTKIVKYVELAPVRKLIFSKACGPASIIIYKFSDDLDENLSNEIEHLTFRPNVFFKYFNLIVSEKNDYKFIPQLLLLENDWAWKTLVFGSFQDVQIIKYLKSKFSSLTDFIKEKKLIDGVGIQVNGGDENDASFLRGKYLIKANGIEPFAVETQGATQLTGNPIHRPRTEDLFKAPFVLLRKGSSTKNFQLRAVFSEADLVYPDAVRGICGKPVDKKALLSLTGILNSSLFGYLNLMLGSSIGIEREQALIPDINSYPVIVDDEIAQLVETIQNSKLRKDGEILNSYITSDQVHIGQLNDLVLSKFGLLHNEFVDFVLNVQIPMLTGNYDAWTVVQPCQLKAYLKIFIDYFQTILAQKRYVFAEIFPDLGNNFCAVRITLRDFCPDIQIVECKDNLQAGELINTMLRQTNSLFYQLKDIIGFRDDSFYVVKTNEYKNWHPAIAKMDLTEILDSILAQCDKMD